MPLLQFTTSLLRLFRGAISRVASMSIAGKVTYFTAMFPYVVLVILFAYSLTLEGAGRGIAAYLTPDPAALMNPEAWIAAGNQGHHSIENGKKSSWHKNHISFVGLLRKSS